MNRLQYWRGRFAGRWQQIWRRANVQYVRGYLAGLLQRWWRFWR